MTEADVVLAKIELAQIASEIMTAVIKLQQKIVELETK